MPRHRQRMLPIQDWQQLAVRPRVLLLAWATEALLSAVRAQGNATVIPDSVIQRDTRSCYDRIAGLQGSGLSRA